MNSEAIMQGRGRMSRIINEKGLPQLGIFNEEITDVNYADYFLETALGFKVPRFIRKFLANQFCFIGIISSEIMAGLAVVDLKYASNAFFYVYSKKNKKFVEVKKIGIPLLTSVFISSDPANPLFHFKSDSLSMEFSNYRIKANSDRIKLDAVLDPSGTSPLRICTKAGYRGWVYTEKTTPLGITGVIDIDGKEILLESPETLALMDWTCGYMRRHTCWNWASTACRLGDDRQLGLNLSWGVNETGWTENAFWLDGKMTRCSNSIFIFDRDDLMKPWKIYSEDGKIDLDFVPEATRSEKLWALVAASRFTQLSGVFNGVLRTSEGDKIILKDIPGWTEDHFAKW